MILYVRDFLIPGDIVYYAFRNILDIESWENRGRDIWYRMFGKSCKKNMRVRYAMLSIKFLSPKGYSPMHTKQ